MLRMGRNPNEEKSQTQTQTGTDSYSSRTYTPQQNGETYARTNENAAAPKALTESETIAREIKDGSLNGFVGSGTVVSGEATFKSMLRIDGHFSGRITSASGALIVGAGGQVDANIEVAVATIQGAVNGDIVASQRIELGRAARLNGNLQTPSLVIEQGAVFEGACKMVQQKAAADKTPKVERKANVLDTSAQPARVDTPLKKAEDGSSKKPDVVGVAVAS